MKKLLISIMIATSIQACITPIKPIPPVGCTYSDAVLITNPNGSCYWVFIGC